MAIVESALKYRRHFRTRPSTSIYGRVFSPSVAQIPFLKGNLFSLYFWQSATHHPLQDAHISRSQPNKSVNMLEIRLSGRFEVKLDGRPVPLPSRPAQSLFAYLALSPGTAHRREKLAGLLWPESSDDNARRNLRQSLWHIRKTLGDAAPHYLHSDDMTVAFAAAVNFWLDVALLEKPIGAEATPEELMAIVSVYGGELLPGFYDDWVVWQRERQQSLFERKMEQLLDRLTAVHRWDDLLEWGERWLAFGQSPEVAYRALMVAHAGRGDLVRMAAVYRRCVDALEKELGVEPSPQTRALFEQLLHSQEGDVLAATLFPLSRQLAEEAGHDGQSIVPQVQQTQPDWEPPDSPTADLDAPPLLSSAPPLLRSSAPPLSRSSAPLHNLPPQATSFIGREAEVTAVCHQLAQPTTRLLTLTGTGGTGKTRLCLQVAAAALPDFADGVWFVLLAAITDPTLVAATIARQLGLQESPGMPPWPDVLAAYLREKELLLVLDNFERIVTAAPQLAEWLTAAPRLKILITSRVSLHLSIAQSYEVLPLLRPDPQQLPPLAQLQQVESVQLFVERARETKPAFALALENAPDVAEICTRLDGLPLALELAAARIRLMSPRQMRTRLNRRLQWLTGGARDAPARQQTLRATLDWSHDLLPAAEQTLFRRLAVFVSGCTLEATEAIANADGNLDILNGLESLLDHHLLQQHEVDSEPRFTMLETIREYALEKLAESGEQERLWQQHTAYFVALAERAEPELRRANQLLWLDRLESENDNLQAALTWSCEHDPQEALRLVGALAWFWYMRGYWQGVTDWQVKILALPQNQTPSLARLKALTFMVRNSWGGGDRHMATTYQPESLSLARRLADKELLVYALCDGGSIEAALGNQTTAQSLLDEALRLSQQTKDIWLYGYASHYQGLYLAAYRQDYVAARIHHETAVEIFEEIRDDFFLADSLYRLSMAVSCQGHHSLALSLGEASLKYFQKFSNNLKIAILTNHLGDVAYNQGDMNQARKYVEEGLRQFSQLGVRWGIAQSFMLLGEVALVNGEYEQAKKFFADSLTIWRERKVKYASARLLALLGQACLQPGEIEQAMACFQESLCLAQEVNVKKLICRGVEGMAGVWAARGETLRAATLLGATAVYYSTAQNIRAPAFQVGYEKVMATIRAQLDEDTFTQTWAAGQAMSLEEVVALALWRE
jgi:predicted ATPase/DNA-binding SARP family transcriptional activator